MRQIERVIPRRYHRLMKIAISVPDEIFEAGEYLAKQLGLSRSQLYTDALSAYLGERGATAVTAKLNAVYAQKSSKLDPPFAKTQLNRVADEAW
jgi:metal-responsive CopG/Arc/MetJ family transcriptional regulator